MKDRQDLVELLESAAGKCIAAHDESLTMEVDSSSSSSSKVSQEAENCSICHFELAEDTENRSFAQVCQDSRSGSAHSTLKTLECRHTYHKECIMQWAERKSECALCRVHFSFSDFIELSPLEEVQRQFNSGAKYFMRIRNAVGNFILLKY